MKKNVLALLSAAILTLQAASLPASAFNGNSYFGHEDNPAKIRKALTDKFGDLSGYAQQYLFFYKRELEK